MNFDLNFFLKLTQRSDLICELKISSDLLYNSDFRPSLTEHILETILMLETFSLPPLLGIVLRMIESFFPRA